MIETVNLFELKKIQTDFPKIKINEPKASFEFISQFYSDDIEIFESFFILLLNRNNFTLGYAKISQGGITQTVVDIKIIAKYCVDSLASAVIFAHNHPSGNLKPSDSDLAITKNAKKALELLDVKLLDSLIITKDNFYSMQENQNF